MSHGLVGLGAIAAGVLLRARRQSGSEDTAARESDSYGLVVNLGKYSLPVDTLNTRAQCWFDRGINWIAGFHGRKLPCLQRLSRQTGVAPWRTGDWRWLTGLITILRNPQVSTARRKGIWLPFLQWPHSQFLALLKKLDKQVPPSHRALIKPSRHATVAGHEIDSSLQVRYRNEMRSASERFQQIQLCRHVTQKLSCLSPWNL